MIKKEANMVHTMIDIITRYENNKFEDVDLIHIYETNEKGIINISKGLSIEDREYILSKDTDLTRLKKKSSVRLEEFIFGLTSAIANINKYADEIDAIFNKRLYRIDEDKIKNFSKYYRYIQLGYDVSSSIKLALSMLYDMDNNRTVDSERLLDMYTSAFSEGDMNFKGLINPCEKDIVKLLKRMNACMLKEKIENLNLQISKGVIKALLEFATSCFSCIEDEYLINIFAYKDDGAIYEIININDSKELKDKAKYYFNNSDFCCLKDPHDMFEYFSESSNFQRRILKKTGLGEASFSELSFSAGISILPYAPAGFNRADDQFAMYLILNHLYTDINKGLRRYEDEEEFENAKERLYMSYKVSERFGYEKKELHNMAIVYYLLFEICKDLESTIHSTIDNVISNILHLKNFESSKIATMNEMFSENKKLQHELDKLKKTRDSYSVEADKKAYLKVRNEFEDDIATYKKEINALTKALNEANDKFENISEIDITQEEDTYVKKETINLSTMSAVFVGDPNFDESLLNSVFGEIVKVNGYTVSKNHNPRVLMDKHDILIYQSKYMQHVSAEFIKAANDFGKKIIYIDTCNAGLVLSEIYKNLYAS